MERTEGSTSLTEVYRCLLADSHPTHSAAEVAGVLFSGVCGRLYGDDGECAEQTCVSLTVVRRLASSLTPVSLQPEAALYYTETLRVLLEDMDVMLQLVHHFQAEDQIISHLAAKCVSACVFYHLHKSGMVAPVWQHKCIQVFCRSLPGTELDACLWSLTEVLKKLLKGASQGISPERQHEDQNPAVQDACTKLPAELVGNLLAAFDCSLSALCSKLLPEERAKATDGLVDVTSSKQWAITFCLLLDLLEVLTASRLMCGEGVCLKSQRLTYIHCSALLTAISCSSEDFVKKRVLLLLKRTVLHKVGEDWISGALLFTGLKFDSLSSDVSMLTHSVLIAVADNWLQSIQVGPVTFFGGSKPIQEGQKPDCVLLRAVSLILLKSIEHHFLTAGGTGAVQSSLGMYGYLQMLWGFLRQWSVHLMEVTHCCCWVSLLFGEQDDDMMEAAKALLSIFLSHRLHSGPEDSAMLDAPCAFGCNPHCHFVLLLQSISFDHSILLDFLISAETCFLEYFVRYLKYLREDWQGFTAACAGISVSLQQSVTASCAGDGSALIHKDEGELSSCVQPIGVNPAVATELRLVDYDSSEESDPESMEVALVEPGASACEGRRLITLGVKHQMSGRPTSVKQKQRKSSAALLCQHDSNLGRRPEVSSLPVVQREQTPPSERMTCQTSERTVVCLSELRQLVTRLHTKKLFPYNPSSLLKLLEQVDHSHCTQ